MPELILPRTIMLRDLERWGARLGSKLGLNKPWNVRDSNDTCSSGCVLFCSNCTKVVGYTELHPFEQHLLDPAAGWVLERRILIFDRVWMCGLSGPSCEHCGHIKAGCSLEAYHGHPLACSDECENAILADKRFEHCEPPFGYQRGGPHT